MRHRREEATGDVLLGLEQLGRREDRAERHAPGLRRLLDLGARLVREPRRDDVVELDDVRAPSGTCVEFLIVEPRIGDQRARRWPLRHRVDHGDMAVAAGNDLELRALAVTAGRPAAGGGTRGRLPVHPLHHLGQRYAHRGRPLATLASGERCSEAGEGGQPGGVGGLVAAELQRLALGLADHVHQATQRLYRELADRSRCGIHFRWEASDLDRRCLGRPGERRDRGGLLEQAGMGAVEQLREICPSGLGAQVEDQRALGGIEELEQRALARRQQRQRPPHRIAARWLDLDDICAEIGRDLGSERRRQP